MGSVNKNLQKSLHGAHLGLPGMSELGTARAIPMTFQGETITGEIFSFIEKPKPQSFPKNGYYS